MSLIVVTPPDALLSLDQAKAHLRIDGGDEDGYIRELIATAQGMIDGPPGWLGSSFGVQTLELRAPGFDGFTGGGLVLPFGPVIDVQSITYVAVSGVLATLDPAAYAIDADGAVMPMAASLWPSTQPRNEAVRVRYRAGYLPTSNTPPKSTVPAAVIHAIKVMIAMLYESRTGAGSDLLTNPTVSSLLNQLRVYR